jgi:hypothetical protein
MLVFKNLVSPRAVLRCVAVIKTRGTLPSSSRVAGVLLIARSSCGPPGPRSGYLIAFIGVRRGEVTTQTIERTPLRGFLPL